MAADDIGAVGTVCAAGVAARAVELTTAVREVRVVNAHATQYAMVSVAEGSWAENAATAAVVGADNLIMVPPATSKVVWNSPRLKKLVNLSIIASGATTPCYVEGSNWLT